MIMFNPLVSSAPGPPKFWLGQVVATPGAIKALVKAGQDGSEFLARHHQGDWGEMSTADRQANDDAVASGERLLSAYTLGDGVKLWIITEADRSSTCLLLPDEY